MSAEVAQEVPQEEQDVQRKENASDRHPSRGGRWKRVLGTAAITGAVALGGAEVASAHEDPGESCSVVGEKQIESARYLMDQPDDAGLDALYENKADVGEYKQWAREKASEYNLTLIKNEPFIHKIEQVQSVEEGVAELNTFTSEYGFAMKFKGELGLTDVKKGGEHLMRMFTTIPTEFVEASGVKQITVGEKDAKSQPGIIALDTQDFLNGEDYMHQFSHQLDGVTCGGELPEGKDVEERAKIMEKLVPVMDPDTIGNTAPDRDKALSVLMRLQSQVASADTVADMMGYLRSISIFHGDNSTNDSYNILKEKYKG